MKKLLFYLLIFTLFAAAAGCSSGKDDDGNPDVRFYAVPASLNFEAGKTTLQLSISTTGHWTIVCDDEWLEAVPAEGTGSAKVGITAQANPLAQQRTSSLNRDNGMDLTRDSYHMDYGISRYAAAATVFRTLVTPCTGVSVEGNGYRYSTSSTSTTGYSTPVTDANAPVAIRAALEACRTPYAVTDMSKY